MSLQEETSGRSAVGAPHAAPVPGGAAPVERTNVRWKLFVLLLVLVTINYVDRGSISVALPLIQKDFKLSHSMVGLLLSAFFWSYAAMQVPVGWLIDRFGPRKVVTASCVGWGAATAASGLTGGFTSMFIARLGIGVTEAGVMPAGGKLNAIWMHSRERGRGATILDAGAPLGAGVGGILVTGLIAAFGGWRMAFIVAGLVTALLGAIVWRYVRDNPRQHGGVNEAEVEYIEASHRAEDELARAGGSTTRRGLLSYLRFRSFSAMRLGWLGFNGVGVRVIGHRALGLSDNESFARARPDEFLPGSLELTQDHPDALIFLCTNLYGAPIVAELESRTGTAVLDSVAVPLWRCLQLANAPLLDPRWGKLLA